MKLIKDLGQQYPTEKSNYKKNFGLYECPICLKHFNVVKSSVKNGNTTKCRSCATTLSLTTHGETTSSSRIYNIWSKMKTRCYAKSDKSYSYYGGRGITVCKEWIDDYLVFKKWALSNGYKEHLTIDRRENDGNYKPSNCRWATKTTQARNKRLLQRNNKSGYRGVHWHKRDKKWSVKIVINSKAVSLGYFDYPYTAAYAYDSYIIKPNLEHTRNFKGK